MRGGHWLHSLVVARVSTKSKRGERKCSATYDAVVFAEHATPVVWAALLIEIMVAIPRIPGQLSILYGLDRSAGVRLPQSTKDDSQLPRVDIYVPCCGEGDDIVVDTVMAACSQDYPESLVRVIVLDDGDSMRLSETIAQLRKHRYPNLYYTSRNVHVTIHSKAANLNCGLRYTDALPGGSAEFAAVLDVDMIPEPLWLRTVVPHLLCNPNAALAGPFQYYYNVPAGDPLRVRNDLDEFHAPCVLRDLTNKSPCVGSGFVVRRGALDQINGFPEGSTQEDILTSILLSSLGWEMVYIRESLQWGLAAGTFADWIRQRQRWVVGAISKAQYLGSKAASKSPKAVRQDGIISPAVAIISTCAIWTTVMTLLPLLALSGKPLVPSTPYLPSLLRLAVLDFGAQSLYQALLNSVLDFRASLLCPILAAWTAPYRLAMALRCCIAIWFGNPLPRSTPTGVSEAVGRAEIEARKNGRSCLKIIFWDCGAWIYLCSLVILLAGAAGSVVGAWRISSTSPIILQALGLRIGWPPLLFLWLASVNTVVLPVTYAVSPPPFLERRDLMDQDPVTGVLQPKKSIKEAYLAPAGQKMWFAVAAYYLVCCLLNEGRFLNVE
ncbi:MAG: hypothetical protein L6R36_005400 [Xanthoria steineri]|nr:MAG: hypothetical protein L6R36_005400 [Xanthoria steineri]